MKETAIKGTVGTVAAIGAAVVKIESLEAILRVGSLVVGIIVGLITIYSLLSRMWREEQERKNQRPWDP